jgi:hypothetical protein
MSVAHPILGTIVDNHAQCACGRMIKLLRYNWVHADSENPMCEERGDSGGVQQKS